MRHSGSAVSWRWRRRRRRTLRYHSCHGSRCESVRSGRIIGGVSILKQIANRLALSPCRCLLLLGRSVLSLGVTIENLRSSHMVALPDEPSMVVLGGFPFVRIAALKPNDSLRDDELAGEEWTPRK